MPPPAPNRSALRIGGWVVAARIAPQASGLLLLVMGGRYLAPETLGSFVFAFAAVELMRHLVRAGWREAVLMDDPGTATPTILALALVSGIVAQPLILGVALLAPRLTTAPDITPALLLLGLSVLPLGAAAVWEGILLRRKAPERAAGPLIAAEMVQAAIAAALLATGWGILALAAARAIRAAVLALGLAAAAGWPCALSLDLSRARRVLDVSRHVTLSALAGLAGTAGVDLVVGFILGPAAVAHYRIAARVAGAVAEVVTETTRVLAWSALAGSGPIHPKSLARLFDRTFVLAAPVFLGLALVSGPLIDTILGATWTGAAPVLAILAIARLLAVPVTLAAPALASHGRTRELPRLAAVLALAGLLATLVAGPAGLKAVAAAQLATAAFGTAAVFALLRPITPVGVLLPGPITLAALAALAFVVTAAGSGPGPAPAVLVLQVATGVVLWAAFLRLGRPALAADLLRRARAPDA